MTYFDVLCVGSATLDTIALTAAYPDEDTRVEADEVVTAGGGPAATAAVALARLGVSVGFIGAIADDAAGRSIREGLEAEGVDTRWMTTGASHSGASVITVSSEGARTIVTRPAAAPAAGAIPHDAADWLHADQTGFSAVAGARADGCTARLSIDAGNPIPGLTLAGVEVYAPTRAALLTRYPGELDAALHRARLDGAANVVATDGERGAFYLSADVSGSVPAVALDAVSTLGAGDVFHGALLAALVRGADLRRATEIASWVAAMSCRALDGRAEIPRLGGVRERFPDFEAEAPLHTRGHMVSPTA